MENRSSEISDDLFLRVTENDLPDNDAPGGSGME